MTGMETERAIELIKQGNVAEGAKILSTVIKDEPDNEQAWLWMSACVGDREKKIYCLQRVFQINPYSPAARKGLAALGFDVQPPVQETPLPVGEDAGTNGSGFRYSDLTAALGERDPENKEPTTPLKARMTAVVEPSRPIDKPFAYGSTQTNEEKTHQFTPTTSLDEQLSTAVTQPAAATSAEKAMMLEDFGFSPPDEPLPPAQPLEPIAELRQQSSESLSAKPRRRRRKTSPLTIVILVLLILLLVLVLAGKFVFHLF